MSVPSMRDRLLLMQLIRSGANPDDLRKEACQQNEELMDRKMQKGARGLISKQGEIQQIFAKGIAEEASTDPTHSAREKIAQLQNQVTVARNGNRELQQELREGQKELVETEKKVETLTGDLARLRTALQGVGGSRYEKLALQTANKLIGGRSEHWHPEAPKAPRKKQ